MRRSNGTPTARNSGPVMPQAMVSSRLSAPTPTIRSMKMRLPVTRVCTSSSTWRVSANAFLTFRSKPAGRSAFTPPTRP